MNPYMPYLYCIPGFIAIMSAFPKRRILRILFIIIAAGIYWAILPKYVSWAYTHPFNPNDGAALSFAALFGWLVGLIILILPLHFGTRLIIWGYTKKINKTV